MFTLFFWGGAIERTVVYRLLKLFDEEGVDYWKLKPPSKVLLDLNLAVFKYVLICYKCKV